MPPSRPLKDIDSIEQVARWFAATTVILAFLVGLGLLMLLDFPTWAAVLISGGASPLVLFVVKRIQNAFDRPIDALFGQRRVDTSGDNEWESLRDKVAEATREGHFEAATHYYKAMMQMPQGQNSAHLARTIGALYEERLQRPTDAVYWYRRAQSMIRVTQPEKPEEHPLWESLKHSIENVAEFSRNPDGYVQTRLDEARNCLEIDQVEDAVKILKDLVERHSNESEAWFLLGLGEARMGQLGLAAERYREAVRCDEGHLRARFNLAVAYQRQERLIEAVESWRDYLELAGNLEEEREYVASATEMLAAAERVLRPAEMELTE